MYSNDKKTEAQAEFDSLVAAEPNDPNPVLAQVSLFNSDFHGLFGGGMVSTF